MSDFFTKDVARSYDERNSHLAPITDTMHFLVRLILKNAPAQARILCIGVGTGTEIFSLSEEFPEWTFVGVDPSADMLAICHERLQDAGILDRCELIQGYVQDVPAEKQFDVVLSILVGHFVPKEERLSFYQSIYQRLTSDGYFINAEISFDLHSKKFLAMLPLWEQIQLRGGGTLESVKKLPDQLRTMLTVLPPEESEHFIKESGFNVPVRFFQAAMIQGWYCKKNSATSTKSKMHVRKNG